MAVIRNRIANKLLSGTSGRDDIENWASKVTISGGAGKDDVDNEGNSVSINGGAGNDEIDNEGDEVTIIGGSGDDEIENEGDKVTIFGGEGDDEIENEGSKVIISGGAGDDLIWNKRGRNILFQYKKGDGSDKIYGFNASSTLSIGGGSYSTKKSGSNIIVTVGNEKISLIGAASLNKINIKSDYITITNATKSPVTVNSAIKTINASTCTKAVKIIGNSLANTIQGGSGNDTLLGGAGNDKLYGNAGNDKLYGGKGNDTLTGGKGNDSLWGDAGKDTFIYANGDGKDVIFGFDNTDMLKITGKFSTSYNKSKKEIYFKVGSTANAITLKDFSATSFNVNGTNYKISGSKLVKK